MSETMDISQFTARLLHRIEVLEQNVEALQRQLNEHNRAQGLPEQQLSKAAKR